MEEHAGASADWLTAELKQQGVAAACARQACTYSLGLPGHNLSRGCTEALPVQAQEEGSTPQALVLLNQTQPTSCEQQSVDAGAKKGVHTLKREIRARFNLPPTDTIKRPLSGGRDAEGARRQSPPVSPVPRNHDHHGLIWVKRPVACRSTLRLLRQSAGGPGAASCKCLNMGSSSHTSANGCA